MPTFARPVYLLPTLDKTREVPYLAMDSARLGRGGVPLSLLGILSLTWPSSRLIFFCTPVSTPNSG